jgi:hypothetical protein
MQVCRPAAHGNDSNVIPANQCLSHTLQAAATGRHRGWADSKCDGVAGACSRKRRRHPAATHAEAQVTQNAHSQQASNHSGNGAQVSCVTGLDLQTSNNNNDSRFHLKARSSPTPTNELLNQELMPPCVKTLLGTRSNTRLDSTCLAPALPWLCTSCRCPALTCPGFLRAAAAPVTASHLTDCSPPTCPPTTLCPQPTFPVSTLNRAKRRLGALHCGQR